MGEVTQDIRILAAPKEIQGRIKDDALKFADQAKDDLTKASETIRSPEIRVRLPQKAARCHMPYLTKEIQRWAKMQGYKAEFDEHSCVTLVEHNFGTWFRSTLPGRLLKKDGFVGFLMVSTFWCSVFTYILWTSKVCE